jgi:excisionase family DNA binding protein
MNALNQAFLKDHLKPFLLNSRQAAVFLNISQRTLWTLVDSGDITVVRIGRSVRYDPRDLERWLQEKKNGRGTKPTCTQADLPIGPDFI